VRSFPPFDSTILLDNFILYYWNIGFYLVQSPIAMIFLLASTAAERHGHGYVMLWNKGIDVGVALSLVSALSGWQTTMRTFSAFPLSLLSLLLSLFLESEASSLDKREFDLYDYFVLEHEPASGVPLHDVLEPLGLELVEKAGQLKDHWLLRRLKDSKEATALPHEFLLHRRAPTGLESADPYTQHLAKAVKHIAPQTLRQRVKRGVLGARVPQSVEWSGLSSETVAEREGIIDPEFKNQWVRPPFHHFHT
jgi:hypothetical protein